MTPWSNAYINVISRARLFARAYDDARSFHGFSPHTYRHWRIQLAKAKTNLEISLAHYRAEYRKVDDMNDHKCPICKKSSCDYYGKAMLCYECYAPKYLPQEFHKEMSIPCTCPECEWAEEEMRRGNYKEKP